MGRLTDDELKQLLSLIQGSVQKGNEPQTLWFKLCTGLVGFCLLLVGVISNGVIENDKSQDKSITKNARDIAVIQSELKRVNFKE